MLICLKIILIKFVNFFFFFNFLHVSPCASLGKILWDWVRTKATFVLSITTLNCLLEIRNFPMLNVLVKFLLIHLVRVLTRNHFHFFYALGRITYTSIPNWVFLGCWVVFVRIKGIKTWLVLPIDATLFLYIPLTRKICVFFDACFEESTL